MKKLFLVAVMALLSVGAYAQQGKLGFGAQVNLASENNLFGIGGHLNYCVTNPVRLQFSGDYYFNHNHMSMGDLNFDAHYLFNVANKVSLYPLAGLTVEFFSTDLGGSTTRVGGNVGGGIEVAVADNVSIGCEMKGQLVEDFSRFNAAFKLTYKF